MNKHPFPHEDRLPDQPHMVSRPRHRLWRWLWLLAVVVALLLGYVLGHQSVKQTPSSQQGNTAQQVIMGQQATSTQQVTTTQQGTTTTGQQATSTQQPTPTGQQVGSAQQPATSTQTWTTIYSYQSSGNKTTQVFTAPKSWILQWQCNPASYSSKQYNLVVDIYGSDGSLITPAAVNALCKPGNTSDMLVQNQGGKMYFDVFSQGQWTLNVQQSK